MSPLIYWWILHKKQEAHGPHRSPVNQTEFKSINTKLWLYQKSKRWFVKEKSNNILFIIKWSLFIKPWVPFIYGCLMQSLVEIDLMVLQQKTFLDLVIVFRYFVTISPWKRAWPFIWTHLNPLYPRMLCAKFGWNWPCGSGEEDFFKLQQCIFTIS